MVAPCVKVEPLPRRVEVGRRRGEVAAHAILEVEVRKDRVVAEVHTALVVTAGGSNILAGEDHHSNNAHGEDDDGVPYFRSNQTSYDSKEGIPSSQGAVVPESACEACPEEALVGSETFREDRA